VSSRDPRKAEGCPIPTKELCRQEEERSKLQSWRFRLPQGFTHLRDLKISGAWKVGPQYIGPYKVLKRVGAVAYRLELPEEMSDIHPVFHVSQLRRCLKVLEEKRVPVETIDLQPDLRYQEMPIKILDTVVKKTRTSEVRVCRAQWSRHGVEEATWEREDALRKEFPHLFGN
jgi:hypothetical protein